MFSKSYLQIVYLTTLAFYCSICHVLSEAGNPAWAAFELLKELDNMQKQLQGLQ